VYSIIGFIQIYILNNYIFYFNLYNEIYICFYVFGLFIQNMLRKSVNNIFKNKIKCIYNMIHTTEDLINISCVIKYEILKNIYTNTFYKNFST